MVSISVNDRELYVPSDTQVVIEQHNAVFDADNIASEIVWTFDLPAAPNDTILNNVTHEHVSCYKEYSCKIAYDGMQIASGKLYVQQVSSDTLMCGIVLNNLHQAIDHVPVVLFYPGKYDGQELILFGEIKDDNYYRAFKLVD